MNLENLLFPTDYFEWLLRSLKMFGLYPPKEYKRRIVYYILSLPHIVLMLLSIVLGLLNVLLNQETFHRKMLNIGILTMDIAAGLRVLSWLWTKNKFEEVIGIIRRPSFEFSVFGYTGKQTISKHNRTSIDAFKSTTVRRTNLICCCMHLIVIGYISLNLLTTYGPSYYKETYEKFNPVLGRTSVYRDFPYPMWFPFDVSISDGYYSVAFFYQLYAYNNLMSSFWCVDWLTLSSVMQLQNQLAVVSFALEEVDKGIPETVSTEEMYTIKEVRLTKCVQEINEIFRAANLLEELCNKQLLVQNGLATFMLCALLYVSTSLEIAYISAVTGIIVLEPFTQCWICQSFTLEFSNVLEKIYELDWKNYPTNLKRFLLLTMTRLQKPAVFTLGKWKTIDISLYLQLMRLTYSFYTLISRQNKDNK